MPKDLLKDIFKFGLAAALCVVWMYGLLYIHSLPSDDIHKLTSEELARVDARTKEWARQLHEKEVIIINGELHHK